MLHRDEIVHAHSLADPDEPATKLRSADFLLEVMGRKERCRTKADAAIVLQTALHSLLNADRYLEAAALCWGQHLFDPRPLSVRRVWHAITHFTRVLIMGAGSMGKTYTVMAHDLLDWVRDPWYTTIKIISTTSGHARAQTMSILVRFHRQSLVPLPGYIRQGYIGMDKDDRRSAISEVAIDKGSELEGKSGKLQGFHPLPRPKEHPVFGRLSRVRARLDEAEDVPPLVWPGLANMMLTESADDMNVAVAGMFNPKRRDSAVAIRAEPVGGWRHFDLDKSKEWESTKGFRVVRLDGADCENVVQKRKVYEGLLTWEAYQELEDQPNNPDYYTFARGAYPISSAAFNIVSAKSLDDSRGTFIWKRAPRPCGSLDSAFEEGGDNAIYTAAQYGEAIAFLPEAAKRPIKFRQSRWCIQYDQQFLIEKQNTLLMARDVMELSRRLGITAEWFIMDRTGNATGLHDALKLNWGNVLGVNWGEGATEVPILEEDTEKAIDQFDDVITEMFVTMGRWSEFGYIAFSPAMVTGPLFAQLSSRQYKRISKTKIRIESKKVYKKRLSTESPDEADSAIMIPHLIRMRATRDQIHAMEPEKHVVHDPVNYFEAGALQHAGPETPFDRMERVTMDE
jgi:hypothetical protein